MDLQHLHSELLISPDILAGSKKFYDGFHKVTEVNSVEDIDILNFICRQDTSNLNEGLSYLQINKVIAHANVLKPFVNLSEGDFFI